jgi:hypothetical protein
LLLTAQELTHPSFSLKRFMSRGNGLAALFCTQSKLYLSEDFKCYVTQNGKIMREIFSSAFRLIFCQKTVFYVMIFRLCSPITSVSFKHLFWTHLYTKQACYKIDNFKSFFSRRQILLSSNNSTNQATDNALYEA